MSFNTTQSDQVKKFALEVENLRQQNDKLAIEIQALKSTSPTSAWEGRVIRFFPVFMAFLVASGLWFSVMQYLRFQDEALAQQKEATKIQRLNMKRESAKLLWSKQLEIYLEVVDLAATISTTGNDKLRKEAEARFWVLYWGPLAAIEDVGLTKSATADVEASIVRFGKLLSISHNERDISELRYASLSLAHAIRKTLPPVFEVETAELQNLRTDGDTK